MTPMPCQRLHHCTFPAAALFALVLAFPAAAQLPNVGQTGTVPNTASGAGAATAPAASALSTEAIAARSVPATVTIVTFDAGGDTLGMGSGFFVRSTGVLVTNHHVMAGAHRAVVLLASGERYDRVEALDDDADADLAILKIPGYGLPVLPATAVLPAVGAKLVAVGNPLGLTRTVSEGIVSAVRLVDGRQLLQMSVPISPGSSGGPVLNGYGEVVAVATKYLKDGQNLNFAVPVHYAMGMVEAARTPVPLAQRFGDARRGARPPTGDRATALRPPAVDRPRRAASPRATIAGVYGVGEQVFTRALGGDEEGPHPAEGILLLGQHDAGWYIRDRGDEPSLVWNVLSSIATPDGRVLVDIGGSAFAGYQTEDGLHLEVQRDPTAAKLGVRIRVDATWWETRLSSRAGLYSAATRTHWHSNQYGRGSATDWTGEAVVAIVNDSVYIDLYLENEVGGTSGSVFVGPLDSTGRFDLRNESGKQRVKGQLASGRFSAEWTDRRESGWYQGDLVARRQ